MCICITDNKYNLLMPQYLFFFCYRFYIPRIHILKVIVLLPHKDIVDCDY